MSFKNEIAYWLKTNKKITLDELSLFSKQQEHKFTTADRELRHLMEEGKVDKIEQKTRAGKMAIVGYEWVGGSYEITNEKVRKWNEQFIRPEIKKEVVGGLF